MLLSRLQPAVVYPSTEAVAVGGSGAERLLESVWRVTGQACGSGCIDKGGGNGCGGAELVRLMQAVRVDASTKAAAVGVLEPSWRVGRW